MYELFDQHLYLEPAIFDELPNLQAYVKRFRELANIELYMKSDKYLAYPINGPMATFGGK